MANFPIVASSIYNHYAENWENASQLSFINGMLSRFCERTFINRLCVGSVFCGVVTVRNNERTFEHVIVKFESYLYSSPDIVSLRIVAFIIIYMCARPYVTEDSSGYLITGVQAGISCLQNLFSISGSQLFVDCQNMPSVTDSAMFPSAFNILTTLRYW